MKRIFFLLCVMLPVLAVAQTKVAVYVTASDDIDDATKQIVGNELVTALVSNPSFTAIERTADFLNELRNEHSYQRSGNVEDHQIRLLGKQFGAEMVCVANIMPFKNGYYIQARLLNVETASVEAAARETTSLSSIEDFVTAAESLASKLVGKKADANKYGQEYSTVLYGETDCDIISIDNTGYSTIVTFKYITTRRTAVKMSQTVYIVDNKWGDKYKALEISGIGSTDYTYMDPGIHTFTVTFEKLPDFVSSIDIVEPNGWKWTKITLHPYERENYYLFRDDATNKYKSLIKGEAEKAAREREMAQREREERERRASQQQAIQETFQNNLDKLGDAITNYQQSQNSYILEIRNTKNYAVKVVLDNRILGTVNAYKTQEYLLDIDFYGKLQLIQQSGYVFSPTVYTWNLPKQQKQTRRIISTP